MSDRSSGRPISQLYIDLIGRKRLAGGLVEWYDGNRLKFCGRIDQTGLVQGIPGAAILFHWVAAHEQGYWRCLWRKSDQPARPTSGKSGQGLWSPPKTLGLDHGQISIGYDIPAFKQIREHRIVVSQVNLANQRWYGLDGIQPLTEYRCHYQQWQLAVIEPIPARDDQLPTALISISNIVRDCQFNSWWEGVPYYDHLLTAA